MGCIGVPLNWPLFFLFLCWIGATECSAYFTITISLLNSGVPSLRKSWGGIPSSSSTRLATLLDMGTVGKENVIEDACDLSLAISSLSLRFSNISLSISKSYSDWAGACWDSQRVEPTFITISGASLFLGWPLFRGILFNHYKIKESQWFKIVLNMHVYIIYLELASDSIHPMLYSDILYS